MKARPFDRIVEIFPLDTRRESKLVGI